VRTPLVGLAALVVALGCASAAQAITVSVGSKDGGHPYMRWDLDGGSSAGPGTCVGFIEVATNPAEGTDGYFYFENTVLAALNGLDFQGCARQGEWVSSTALPPGTYFIHARYERESDFSSWWGETRSFTIEVEPEPPTEPPPAVNTRPRLTGKLLLCCEIITARKRL
jgi:hypothetical protein